MSGLRLGFHYHVPAARRGGEIFTPGYLGRFLDTLGDYCEQVVCFFHTPLEAEETYLDYRITSRNVKLVEIGPHASVPQRMMRAGQFTRPVREWRGQLDALLIRGPSPLLSSMARAAGDLPVALLLVGDYLSGVKDLPQPRWRKEVIRLWSAWNRLQQNRVARRSLTFVNSRHLYEEMQSFVPDLVETRTTTLSANDFFERSDTCLSPSRRLLYTGRMDRAKGLFEMVESLARLVAQGEDVVLDLVGWPDHGDTILEELNLLSRDRGVAERVKYHGYKAVGPELFDYYKQADIYVVASKSSEGFPRTIWEAMAHSLPVVATRVGSIPHFLQGAAQLVAPSDVDDLTTSLSGLLHAPTQRQQMIRQGMELALRNTLETQVRRMLTELEEWIGRRS